MQGDATVGIGMRDKRRFRRFSVDILGISGKMLFANKVEIIDISIGGVSLKVDRRLNIGNEYTLKMGNGNETITLKGEVVWSKISGTKKGTRDDVIPIYTAGMRFAGVAGGDASGLARFIERVTHHTHEEAHQLSGLRLSMRFPVRETNNALLDLSENYTVKKLSLGGMLIRSGAPLALDKRLPMEIFLPGGRQIRFIGRIASCFEIVDTSPVQFDVGIEFSEMPEADRSSLREFIFLLDKNDDSR
jgi:hypothetical protein